MRISAFISLIISAFLLAACGIQPVRSIDGNEGAMAYGNISVPEGTVTRVYLHKVNASYSPPYNNPPLSHTYNNGNFLFENLKPGKYILAGCISNTQEAYYFKTEMSDKLEIQQLATIDIEPGQIKFLGSYQMAYTGNPDVSDSSYDLLPVKQPSSKDILQHLLQITKGTGWDEKIELQLPQQQLSLNN